MLNYSRNTKVLDSSACFSVVLITTLLAGCATHDKIDMVEYEKLRDPKTESRSLSEVASDESEDEDFSETFIVPGPVTSVDGGVVGEKQLDAGIEMPEGLYKGSYNNMRVPTFINEVFGDQLGLSFSIDPGVQALTELVSLRLMEEVPAKTLFDVAQQTLSSYGISVRLQRDLFVFSLSEDAGAGDTPLVLTGVALPDVPESHRPLFVFYPIKVVGNNSLKNWLMPALRGQDIDIQVIPETNALLLKGKRPVIEQTISMIELLDQPTQRGSFTAIIEPLFSDAANLSNDLMQILRSQGYQASNRPPLGGIIILPMRSVNKIVLVASDESTLGHAVDWAKSLDKQTTGGIQDGVFSYSVRNTDVEYLVDLLNRLEGEIVASGPAEDGSGESRRGNSGRFISDTNRNAIVYRGSGKDWVELLPSIREMDQPTPSVLVEVLLAEVTLNDQDETGIEFLARSGDVTFSTLGGLGLGGSGLTATLNRAGETRAILNAFYRSERANIRSRPRLMVKSGQQARIDVGNEIPFVTSTSQSTDNPGAPVIQTVDYRKTGVLLQIEPIVHSSGFVDIRLSQQLSEAQQTSTSSIDSPTVFNRSLETTVTLRDGGSVLLGGLISETKSDSDNGIKGLGKIPGVGRLFRADSSSTDRTELVMMVIPYIIENPDEAAEITDRALEFLELTR